MEYQLYISRKNSLIVTRLALCGLACAFLTGCFFTPGRFQSELDIRRDGRFSYSYVGQVVFLMPEEKTPSAWDDTMAECFADDTGEARACAEAEVAAKRQAYEADAKQGMEAGSDIAQLVGYNPLDTQANEKLAAELMEYPGWKRVTYLGKGTFEVEYELSGTLDRDFVFPVIPQVQMAMPFVNVARNKAGVLNISAAGLSSEQLRRLMVGQTPKVDQDDPYYLSLQQSLFRANGTFTVTTDAEVIVTDGRSSQSGGLQRLEWTIDSKTSNAPQIQLRLDTKP